MLISRIALTALVAAGMMFGALADVAHAKPKSKPKATQHHSRQLQTAPVYLDQGPGIISGYRNTPENWVPPPMTGGGVG
jgi:hypothetical protein